MSTAWRQYGLKFRHRQQGLKEIEGYEWVLIFSWLGSWLGAPVLRGLRVGRPSDSFAAWRNFFCTFRGY
jgi:hypothetical protein